MKIIVKISVDIDPESWTTTFGTEGAADIRNDVKDYIGEGARHMGALGNGEVTVRDWSWK